MASNRRLVRIRVNYDFGNAFSSFSMTFFQLDDFDEDNDDIFIPVIHEDFDLEATAFMQMFADYEFNNTYADTQRVDLEEILWLFFDILLLLLLWQFGNF